MYVGIESDLPGNLLKNQLIKFTSEVVENVYKSLPFKEK